MKKSPIYATASTSINNLTSLFYTFIYIYAKNLFNFNFILLNRLIEGILTFIVSTTSIFTSKITLLPCNWLITTYNYPLMTT